MYEDLAHGHPDSRDLKLKITENRIKRCVVKGCNGTRLPSHHFCEHHNDMLSVFERAEQGKLVLASHATQPRAPLQSRDSTKPVAQHHYQELTTLMEPRTVAVQVPRTVMEPQAVTVMQPRTILDEKAIAVPNVVIDEKVIEVPVSRSVQVPVTRMVPRTFMVPITIFETKHVEKIEQVGPGALCSLDFTTLCISSR